MAYEQAKFFLIRKKDAESSTEISVGERFIAGSFAGTVGQTVTYPLELVKIRLALGKTNEYRGIIHAAKSVYLNRGIKGFFQGYVLSVIGIIPYAGINLTVYETLKGYSTENFSDRYSTLQLLACGAIATTCGVVCCYPLALLRTQIQATKGSRKPEMMNIVKDIVLTQGISGFYRGLTPNIIKVIPAVSVGYAIYEASLKTLDVKTL
ncbi:calcium-binding mitochondrial carrier protein SCaMC-2-A-like [Lycorma delicatula]|uniref:calcium-binding mitochondrial carrier protein SCaMC-2-A-like n=1 Tax=Lycorma delicatula TaxID=130591 RepID=UPI003F513343